MKIFLIFFNYDKYSESIFICKGARVMLLVNIEVSIGLVNCIIGKF